MNQKRPGLIFKVGYARNIQVYHALTIIALLAICALLGSISLLIPPFISADPGVGFLAWRGTLLGALNCIVEPDPTNIAHDNITFLSMWSPGQILVPGAISLTGIRLGVAITTTVILSLFICLIGWLRVISVFAPKSYYAPLFVLVIGLARYSTIPFEIYNGGEILLQAATPWLILVAFRVPHGNAVRSAALAASAVFLAFLAKLTGLIVIGAALAAGGMAELADSRKISRGMVGGAFGALLAFAVIYFGYIAKGWTAASATNWSIAVNVRIAFAVLVPWVAGISWTDLMSRLFLYPSNPIFNDPEATTLWFCFPIAAFFACILLIWKPETVDKRKFKLFSILFYGIFVTSFIVLYAHGSAISLEERHFRSVGILLFVCAVMAIMETRNPKWIASIFLGLCGLMSVYGLASFSLHVLTTANGHSLDRTSWTNQLTVDAAAIDFMRVAYAREGRQAVFVLPSPEIAVTLPIEARVIASNLYLDEPESKIANLRYGGRVPGHLFVVMPNDIIDTSRGRALLSSFTDYPHDAWERNTFSNTSVFLQ